jgi:hypothetical protein
MTGRDCLEIASGAHPLIRDDFSKRFNFVIATDLWHSYQDLLDNICLNMTQIEFLKSNHAWRDLKNVMAVPCNAEHLPFDNNNETLQKLTVDWKVLEMKIAPEEFKSERANVVPAFLVLKKEVQL